MQGLGNDLRHGWNPYFQLPTHNYSFIKLVTIFKKNLDNKMKGCKTSHNDLYVYSLHEVRCNVQMKSTCLGCLCSVYVGITTHLTNRSNQAIYKHRHQSMHILNERIMWNLHTHNYIQFLLLKQFYEYIEQKGKRERIRLVALIKILYQIINNK